MIRMFRVIAILLFTTTNLTYTYGQEIFGKVVDFNDAPIKYANVLVLTQNDSIFVKGETTDSIGRFIFNPIKEDIGPYMIKVCALGYRDTCVYFSNSPCEIKLKESPYYLGEVVVHGKKNIFQQTPTGIKTNIAGTRLSNLSSMSEMFDYIPGLFKTPKGDYNIAGKGTPVFYLNGRRVYDNTEIENLSPNTIKAVEIVRNPGVSYNADIKAIVKISTKRESGDGFSMNLRSSYYYWTNSDCVEQFNWNFRNKELDIFGNHSFVNQNTAVESNLTQMLFSDVVRQQENNQNVSSSDRIFKNTVGLNYCIDKKNNIGIKYNVDFPLNTLDEGTLNSHIYVDGKSYDQLTSRNFSKNESPARHHVNAYYRGDFGKFTVGTDLDFLKNEHSYLNTYSESSKYYQDRTVQTNGNVSNTLFASKVFSQINFPKWSFTLGTDYSWTHRKNEYYSKANFIDCQNDNIHETHLSPYMDIEWNIGDCQIMGGVRYENVWTKYLFNGNYSRKKNSNVYPYISAFLPIQNVSILASYSIKDRKPTYEMLRNEVTYGNRFTYQTGNPYLKPEKIHNMDLSIVFKWLQFVFQYTDRRNAILYSSDFYKGNTSIALISFSNIPTLKSATGSVSISPSFGFWNPSLTLAVTKQFYSMETTYGNIQMNNPILMTNFSNMFDFGKGWKLNMNVNYTSKGDSENCKLSRPTCCVDLSIYKYFINNNLAVNVGMTDLFDSQKSGNILNLNNLKTTQIEWQDNREVSITLTYRFNATKNRYKGGSAGKEEQERL